VRRPLVQHLADQAHERHLIDEMFGKQLLAGIGLEVGKAHAGIRNIRSPSLNWANLSN
jgi:hypothetical protein